MSQCKPRLSKNGLCKTTTLHRAIFLPVFLLLVAFAQAQSQYCVDFCGNGSETMVYDENLEYYVGQSNPNIALYKIDHVFPNYWNLVLAVAGEPVFNYRKISDGSLPSAGTYSLINGSAPPCPISVEISACGPSCQTPMAFTVTGGGAYCSGGSGLELGLDNSESGVDYQLQIEGSNAGLPVAGTGAAISFGDQTAAGTYTVVATNTNGGCTAAMSGSATVTINTVPSAAISGATSFCPGSSTTLSVPEQPGATYCWTSSGPPIWRNVGNAGFSAGIVSTPSLAFSGSTPYVAYQDGGNDNKATVMTFNGTAWETVGNAGFSAGTANNPSLAFLGSTPYVAYQDGGNGNKATVMKFTGTAWETVGSAGFSTGEASNTNLAFSGSTPYVAYADIGNNGKATVMAFNGTIWEAVGSAGFSADFAVDPSLAFSGSTPYVAFQDGATSYKATVMKFTGTAWETVGSAGFSTGEAYNLSLALNGSTPYVAYQDETTGYKATTMKFNGTSWETVGSAGFSIDQAFGPSLAFYGSTPYVAYTEGGNSNNKARVMKFNGTDWETVGNANFSAGQAYGLRIAFSGSTPYVAYTDEGNGDRATVMKFALCLSDDHSFSANSEGTYIVTVTGNNGCTASASQAVTVITGTSIYTVTGGGTYCGSGDGVEIALDGSQMGATYQLKLDGANDGSPIDGTGNALSFGNKTAGGTYTVVASVPDGCAVEMTGNAVVTVGPIPTVFEVTGGGPVCSENPATVYIQLSGSEAIQYDLLLNGDPNFTFYGSGDGNPLPINPGIAPGTYTIVATGETGCTALMSGSATLTESNYCIQDIEQVSPQCDAQNTTCTEDDTYTTDVVVHFTGSIPPTGTLEVHFFSTDNEVSFSFSVPVSELSGTSHTFTGLTFNADKIFEVNAAFSETGTVAYQTAFPGTGTCSSGSLVPDLEIVVGGFQGPCDVLNNAYTIVEDGTFAHPSLPGFVVGWNGTAWILGGLTSSTPFAYAPGTPDMVPCTGWVASPGLEGFCGLTTLSISGDCGAPLFAPPPCAINGISTSNLSGCNNPGNTPSAADDYFTADVTVNFAFAPGSGDLTLKRGTTVLATKAASDLACATSWVFEEVQMTADGSDLVLTAEFSAACTFTSGSLGTAPVSCSCVPTAAFSTCPGSQNVNITANTCAATVNYTAEANGTPAPTYTYAFSGTTSTSGPQNGTGSGSSFNLGQTTVTVMANNECGTAAPCTFTVTVKDNEAPTVACPANTATINTNAGASCQITVPNYVASLSPMDNCTAGNSIVEAQSIPAGAYGVSGHGATVTVNYTATDGASPANTKTCTVTITVNDAAPPTVNCPSNIAASATTSACTAAVTFTATATDNCGSPTVTYSPTSGSAFNMGTTTVTATATDGSGKTATCAFTVSVSCQADFGGRIIWKRNTALGVKDVTVTLTGDQAGSMVTPLSGIYALVTAPGTNFELKPTKNLNKLNGVNAQDVLRINQHVATTAPLTDLYDWVAADVNGNNSITALDANIIQLSLLGNPQALAQWFSSWRFIPTAHVLSNPPWGFPEKIALSNSSSNTQTGKDFYGIKVGDVASTYANPANAGQGQPLVLRTPDQTLQAGQTIDVALVAGPLADLAALQFALGFDPEQLQLESMETLDGLPLQTDNFGTHETDLGKLRFLWAASGPTVSLKQTASLFRLRFKVLESGSRLSEVLHLDDEALPGHVYDGKERESGVALRFDASTTTGAPSERAGLQLLQNQPNPFLEQTTIDFVLPEACEAQLRIVDAGGRVVAQRSKQYAAGRHSEWFELQGLSGVLYYELSTPFGVMARKMVVLTE